GDVSRWTCSRRGAASRQRTWSGRGVEKTLTKRLGGGPRRALVQHRAPSPALRSSAFVTRVAGGRAAMGRGRGAMGEAQWARRNGRGAMGPNGPQWARRNGRPCRKARSEAVQVQGARGAILPARGAQLFGEQIVEGLAEGDVPDSGQRLAGRGRPGGGGGRPGVRAQRPVS